MSHCGRTADIAVCSVFNFSIRSGRTLVLPCVFCPGIHQKCFDVTVWIFEVLKDSLSKGAVTSPNASILMHCLDRWDFLFRVELRILFIPEKPE